MKDDSRLVGDPHNFGKRVRRVSAFGKNYYQKPRTLFWEYLFFGLNSPLYQLFESVVLDTEYGQSFTVAKCVFGLSFKSIDGDDDIHVEEVTFAPNSFGKSSCMFKFGVLLGYAYLFGIQDLHIENLVLVDENVQVIDVEQVLSKLILPDQTLLISKVRVPDDKAGILSLTGGKNTLLNHDQFFLILDGYLKFLHSASKHINEILNCIKYEISIQKNKPAIRCILRPTSFYRNIIASKNFSHDLMDEEIQQLNRGDIPYFFKYVGVDEVYWFKEYNVQSKVSSLNQFDGKTEAIGVDPDQLLNLERVENILIPNGTLFLIRNLLEQKWVGRWKNSFAEINVSEKNMEFLFKEKTFNTMRFYK